jgi:hypothetical protein
VADAEQWFAGLPVVGQRLLDDAETERLFEIRSALRRETLIASLSSLVLLIGAVAYVVFGTVYIWLGFIALFLAKIVSRALPSARFFPLRVHRGLRADETQRRLWICGDDVMTMEVLTGSNIIWSRNGEPLEPFVVAHSATTAAVPPHARMAANYVKPVEWSQEVLVHRRAMTASEIRELDSYAPRPLAALLILAVAGAVAAVSSFGLALAGRLNTLFPPVAFLVVSVLSLRYWWRARKRRKTIAADVEACYVVILRSALAEPPGQAEEILPFSHIYWTLDGKAARWRTRVRRIP